MIYINILLIAVIATIIIDLSGFIETVKYKLWNWAFDGNKPYKDYSLKPIDCPLCTTFWVSIIYLIFQHHFTIPLIAYTLLIAFLTPAISYAIQIIRDILLKLLDLITKICRIN